MEGSIFFFIESKTFEFSQQRKWVLSSFSGIMRELETQYNQFLWAKSFTKRLLMHVEEMLSNQSPCSFVRTFREGDKVFILQLGSIAHGTFLLITELMNGRCRGSIVVPEGKLGCGWGGFGFHLRKAIFPDSVAAITHHQSIAIRCAKCYF